MANKTAIITGITGQDGAYLAELLVHKGYRVIGITRSSNSTNLYRLDYVGVAKEVTLVNCDLMDLSQCIKLLQKFRPDEVYNLAAQSSVSLSFEQPIGTMSFNIMSVLNLLEAVKIVNDKIKFYQASSSEMFGKIDILPISDAASPHPLSPYAISKVTGHWAANNYRESYGMFVSCGILFNHESFLRPPNFFVKKAIRTAVTIKAGQATHIKVGNIDLRRDFGYAKEYVKAIWLMLQADKPDNYQVCSGTSVSLREVIYFIFDHLQLDRAKIIQDPSLFRPTDILDTYGNNAYTKERLGWSYNLSFFEVLELLIEEEQRNYKPV